MGFQKARHIYSTRTVMFFTSRACLAGDQHHGTGSWKGLRGRQRTSSDCSGGLAPSSLFHGCWCGSAGLERARKQGAKNDWRQPLAAVMVERVSGMRRALPPLCGQCFIPNKIWCCFHHSLLATHCTYTPQLPLLHKYLKNLKIF